MIRAVGDSALIADEGGLRLVDARGVVARWPGAIAHAACAEPPRLAVLRGDGFVEIVDVATGQSERLVEQKLVPRAFAHDAVRWFASETRRESSGVVLVDGDGRIVEYFRVALSDFVLSRGGLVAGRNQNRTWILGHRGWWGGPDTRPIAFSDDEQRLLLVEVARGEKSFAVDVWLVEAAHEARLLETTARIAAVWASPALDDVAVLDAEGRVHRCRRGEVVARQSRGPMPRALGPLLGYARIDSERGSSVVDGGRSTNACFTPAGACVGVVEGRAIVFDESGERAVEGPTNLVSITPHPRGVIVVDDEERAHVLALDDDGGDDEVSS